MSIGNTYYKMENYPCSFEAYNIAYDYLSTLLNYEWPELDQNKLKRNLYHCGFNINLCCIFDDDVRKDPASRKVIEKLIKEYDIKKEFSKEEDLQKIYLMYENIGLWCLLEGKGCFEEKKYNEAIKLLKISEAYFFKSQDLYTASKNNQEVKSQFNTEENPRDWLCSVYYFMGKSYGMQEKYGDARQYYSASFFLWKKSHPDIGLENIYPEYEQISEAFTKVKDLIRIKELAEKGLFRPATPDEEMQGLFSERNSGGEHDEQKPGGGVVVRPQVLYVKSVSDSERLKQVGG